MRYAMFQGQNVVAVQEVMSAELAPPGSVAIGTWNGWPARPSKYHVLRLVDGALAWLDVRDTTQAWADAREERDKLLRACDWRALRAMETNENGPTSQPWRTYRQALRDITNQASPFALTWPTAPLA